VQITGHKTQDPVLFGRHKFSRRSCTVIAFALAITATIVGWSQSMLYKVIPEVPLCLWFPLAVIAARTISGAVVLSLMQFPIFAVAFSIGIRRWSAPKVILMLMLFYALSVGFAFALDFYLPRSSD